MPGLEPSANGAGRGHDEQTNLDEVGRMHTACCT